MRGHLDRWLAHRYGLAIAFVRRAAMKFAEERLRIGMLSFHDLLMLTARLLREHPDVRRDLGERYRYVLIDEFQDTDPIQAELLFLLASEPDGRRATDWRTVVPRPGALFVVGDPKQSIYRFRRADIVVYNQVRARFEAFGAVLLLTTNFRSRQTLADMVNEVFDHPDRFPREETDRQARFAPMVPHPREASGPEGVFSYAVPKARRSRDAASLEADILASWIRARIKKGERRAGDFLVLTRQKAHLDLYARALEERNVTIEVSGAAGGPGGGTARTHPLARDPDRPGQPGQCGCGADGTLLRPRSRAVGNARAGRRKIRFHLRGRRPGFGGPRIGRCRRWRRCRRRRRAGRRRVRHRGEPSARHLARLVEGESARAGPISSSAGLVDRLGLMPLRGRKQAGNVADRHSGLRAGHRASAGAAGRCFAGRSRRRPGSGAGLGRCRNPVQPGAR